MNLREKLELLMRQNDLKKSDLAKATGIAYTTLDGMLKRDSFENVKFTTLKALCQYFDVDMRFLCFDEIEDPNFGKAPDLPPSLKPDEKQLIQDYRLLSNQGKEHIQTCMASAIALFSMGQT